jgi:hypothetical protein
MLEKAQTVLFDLSQEKGGKAMNTPIVEEYSAPVFEADQQVPDIKCYCGCDHC